MMNFHRTPACKIGLGVFLRMSGWGAALGLMLGGIVGLFIDIVAPSDSVLKGVSVIFGSVVGSMSGLLLGLAIGFTIAFFLQWGLPDNIARYARTAHVVSAFWIAIAALAIGLMLKLRPADVPYYLLGMTITAAIVFGATWWAWNKVATWMKREIGP